MQETQGTLCKRPPTPTLPGQRTRSGHSKFLPEEEAWVREWLRYKGQVAPGFDVEDLAAELHQRRPTHDLALWITYCKHIAKKKQISSSMAQDGSTATGTSHQSHTLARQPSTKRELRKQPSWPSAMDEEDNSSSENNGVASPKESLSEIKTLEALGSGAYLEEEIDDMVQFISEEWHGFEPSYSPKSNNTGDHEENYHPYFGRNSWTSWTAEAGDLTPPEIRKAAEINPQAPRPSTPPGGTARALNAMIAEEKENPLKEEARLERLYGVAGTGQRRETRAESDSGSA